MAKPVLLSVSSDISSRQCKREMFRVSGHCTVSGRCFQRGLPKVPRSRAHFVRQLVSEYVRAFLFLFLFFPDAARRRYASYDVARLILMAPIDPWRNSAPDFGAVAFCMTNIEDFRTPLTSTSLTILSTYSSQKRSLRWTSSKREIIEVIEVNQLEDTNNERLS